MVPRETRLWPFSRRTGGPLRLLLAESTVLRFVSFSLLCGALLATAVSGCGGGGGSAAAPATPSPLSSPLAVGVATPPPGSIYLGGYIDPSGLPFGNSPTSIGAFEAQIGRKLALDLEFASFSTKFGGFNELGDYANGRIPIFSWDCGPPNAHIAAGTFDASIRIQADAIRAYGWPVFVRYMWDMNLPPDPERAQCFDPTTDLKDGYFSPPAFIAAWTHMRLIFAQEGATNAIWLWSVNATGANPLNYYPGAAQVDWVAFDSFDSDAATFDATLTPTYAELAPLQKPIMVSETGAGQPVQTQFLDGAATTLQAQFPAIKGFVYYDGIGAQDWRLTPASMPAFTTFAESPYMAARYAL